MNCLQPCLEAGVLGSAEIRAPGQQPLEAAEIRQPSRQCSRQPGVVCEGQRPRSTCSSGRASCPPGLRWCSLRGSAGRCRRRRRCGCSGAPGSPRRYNGFRSSARSWMAESGVPAELAEACLAHVPRSQVVQAYQRSDLLERRAAVLQAWNEYLG